MNFYPYFPHLLQYLGEILYYKLSACDAVIICEFHEKWGREAFAFLMDISALTHTLISWHYDKRVVIKSVYYATEHTICNLFVFQT
jgi:hypothetical protein